MFNRYDIVDERDVAAAITKLEAHQQGQKTVKNPPSEVHTEPTVATHGIQ